MASIPTVKVKSNDTSFGYIIINADVFNPNEHELFEEPAAPAAQKTPAAPVAQTTEPPKDVPPSAASTDGGDPAAAGGDVPPTAGAYDALSAKDAIAAVEASADAAALMVVHATETRKTVLAAIEKRIAELSAQ